MSGSVGSASGTYSYAASSISSRSSATRRARGFTENHDGEGVDLFDRRSTIENGIFGVLYTIRKDTNKAHIRKRWVIIKVLLDVWQLFTTIVAPARQGWSIAADGLVWKVVSFLNFTWLADLSYGWYLALLYVMVGLLAMHVGLCVWVAWCFKEHKFPVVWPMKVLRLFNSVFFQAFDVAALNLLQLGISCRYTGYNDSHLQLDLFPQYRCGSSPHLVHLIVCSISLGMFVTIALLTNMAEVEVDLLSRRPFALGHSGQAVVAFAIKVLLTLVRVFIGWPRVQACLFLGLSLGFEYQFLRWSPHLLNWVNYLRTGVSNVTVWCSAVLMLLVFHPGMKGTQRDQWADTLTLLLLVGLAPAFASGALMSRVMIQHMTTATLRDIREAKPGAPLNDICQSLDDPRDVEIVARCCRVWKDPYTVDPVAVEEARRVIQAGMAMFPTSPFMMLLQANFMIDVLGVSQSGNRRIEDAHKLNPGLMCRFIMFIRQQEASQHAAGDQGVDRSRGGMDLLAYVEYQRKQRLVVRLHREALQAMCNFWKLLDASRVSFTQLSKALARIDTSVTQAQTAYRVVLESYGSNPKLVRLYGKFLQTIRNDPWRASEYFQEADRLEEMQNGDSGGPLLPDGTPLGRMDEIANAVLVVSATGEVQMANRHAHHLFGHKRGALEGKTLATLLAPHYTRWLAEHLATLVASTTDLAFNTFTRDGHDGSIAASGGSVVGRGGEPSLNNPVVVVGMHSDRLAFPIKLSMQKVSGVGEDSTFIAMMEVVPSVKGVTSLWVAHNGTVVACDPNFVFSFGWKSHEVNGSALACIMAFQQDTEADEPQQAAAVGSRPDSRSGTGNQHETAAAAPVRAMMTGAPISSPSEAVSRLLQLSTRPNVGGASWGRCLMAHKYDSKPMPCTARIIHDDFLDASVYEVNIRLDEAGQEDSQMLVVNRRGTIMHASKELLTCLTSTRTESSLVAPVVSALGSRGDGAAASIHSRPPLFQAAGGGAGNVSLVTAAAAASSPLAVVDQLAAGFTLCDFLPSPWRDMHYKYLRGTTTLTSVRGRKAGSCRKDPRTALGPTLELQNIGGMSLFMNVSVTTVEVEGELNHVIRLTESSLQTALGERRLRLETSHDGIILAVEASASAASLGLDCSQLPGRALWDFLDWSHNVVAGRLPAAGPAMFKTLLKRGLLEPGHSLRVQVSPPLANGVMESELMALARSSMRKTAVLQVIVQLPSDADVTVGVEPKVFVDLWLLSGLSGVLEVDNIGRIRGVLEERIRPAGLLFGVSTQSLVGSLLGEILDLPQGRSRPVDLLFINGTKKSSLKTTTAETSAKVGPVQSLPGAHSDGLPNTLDVQVVGKPDANNKLYVILRSHVSPIAPAAWSPKLPASVTGIAAAAPVAGSREAMVGKVAAAPGAVPSPLTLQHSHSTSSAVVRRTAATRASVYLENAPVIDGRMKPETLPSPSNGVTGIATPPEQPLQRRDVGTTSEDTVQEEGADYVATASAIAAAEAGAHADAAAYFTAGIPLPPLPPPPRSDGLDNLDFGLPVPAVTTMVADKALLPTGRSKLVDMVKSVEGTRAVTSQGAIGSLFDGSMNRLASRQLSSLRAALSRNGTGGSAGSGTMLRFTSGLRGGEVSPILEEQQQALTGVDAKSAAGATVAVRGAAQQWSSTRGGATLGAPILMVEDADSMDGDHPNINPDMGPAGKERISTWVTSQGAYYQNTVIAENDCMSLKSEDVSDPTRGNLPGLGNESPGAIAVASKAFLHRGMAVPAVDGGDPLVDGCGRLPASGDGWAAVQQVTEHPSGGPRPDDDAASEGGQSAMSAQSENGGADYKRGKRFRKLMKLMESSQTQQVQHRYRLHSLGTMFLLAAVHIVCFALTVSSVFTKRDSMLQLGRSGQAQRYMHQVMTDVRSLDQISKNKSNSNLYVRENTTFFLQRISVAADEVQARLKSILDSHHTSSENVRNILFFTTQQVWNGKELDGSDKFTNITIWDFGTRFCAMAKEVHQQGEEWVKNGVDIVGNTTAGQFLIRSGPDLWKASRKVLDALLYVAVDDARWVDHIQIIFLCVEGAAITSVAACYLAYLLRAVAAQRYKLYGTFMLIPLGLTKALASQNTVLTVDDEEDDDDNEHEDKSPLLDETPVDEAELQAGGDVPVLVKQKRRAILDTKPPASFGNRLSSQGGAPRSATAAAGTTTAAAMDDACGSRFVGRRSSRTRSGQPFPAGLMSSTNGRDKAAAGGVAAVTRNFASRVRIAFARWTSRVKPSAVDTSLVSKRRLKNDSHDTFLLLLPFVIWSTLVVTIYTVAVTKMKNIVEVLAVHSVVNYIAARIYRAVFFCQELGAVEDPALLGPRRAAVAGVWKVVRDAWYTLLLGRDAYKAAGPNTERFPLVDSGLSYSSPELAHIIYGNGQCHRVLDGICPGPEYPFYHVIRAGLDTILNQFLMHVEAMAMDKSPVPPGLGDEHLNFVYNVGTKDLIDGTVEMQEAHLHTVMSLFHGLFTLHVILLVLFCVIFGGFLIFLLNPLLKRISLERRRVAELMSQLPLELDMERLVARALGAVSADSGNSGAALLGASSGGVLGGEAGGHHPATGGNSGELAINGLKGEADVAAVTKWKKIIRSTSSQLATMKAQQNSSVHSKLGP